MYKHCDIYTSYFQNRARLPLTGVGPNARREHFVAHPIQTLSAAAQIAQQLRNAIVSDQLPPGYRLPSESELAAE